jgi:cyclase
MVSGTTPYSRTGSDTSNCKSYFGTAPNAAVLVNRDHVLVVDTHSKPSAARALIRQIRAEVTELPVRYVVDSHLHGDHAMGNEAYPEAFGANVEVISSVVAVHRCSALVAGYVE